MVKAPFLNKVFLIFYASDVFDRFWLKKHIFRNRCSTKTTENQLKRNLKKVDNILKTGLFFLTYPIILIAILSF